MPEGEGDDAGRPERFADVYDRYFPRVYGYVRCRVSGREEADDVVSRVFERVLESLPSYDPGRGALESWLFTVARNAVNDHFRAMRRRSWLPLDLLAERRPGREPRAEEALEAGEGLAELAEALGALDGRERDLLALKFEARMTNRAIASMTGLGESHVAVIVYRAVRKLKAALDAGGGRP